MSFLRRWLREPQRFEVSVTGGEDLRVLDEAIQEIRKDLEYQRARATQAENEFTAARHANAKLLNALAAYEGRIAKLETVARKRKK